MTQVQQLAFLDSGRPDGPTLLLVHPMGATKVFWDGCREVWDLRFRSIACDLRGAGDSPAPPGPITFDQHVADLEALVARLGLDRLVLVGCAVGAMVAAEYAAAFPARATALVMANPGIRTLQAARPALSQRVAAVRQAGMDAILPAALSAAFVGCPEDQAKARYTTLFRAHNPVTYAATIEGMLDADIGDCIRLLRCPMLLVPGGRDCLLPPDHAAEIQELAPSAETHLIVDGAHFIPYQRPHEFAGIVKSFVDKTFTG